MIDGGVDGAIVRTGGVERLEAPRRGMEKIATCRSGEDQNPMTLSPKILPETRATDGGEGGVRTLHGGVDLGGHGRGLLELGAHARELARHLRRAEGGTDERGVGKALAGALGGGDDETLRRTGPSPGSSDSQMRATLT